MCARIKLRIIVGQAILLDFPLLCSSVKPYGFDNNLVVKYPFNLGSHSICVQNRLKAQIVTEPKCAVPFRLEL